METAYDEVEILQKIAQKFNDPEWIEDLKKYSKNVHLNYLKSQWHFKSLLREILN